MRKSNLLNTAPANPEPSSGDQLNQKEVAEAEESEEDPLDKYMREITEQTSTAKGT